LALAARAIGSAFAQVFSHFTVTLLSNIAAFLVSLPLLLLIGIVAYPTRSWSLIPIGGALLVGVLTNPAAVGVQSVARDLAHQEDVDLRRQVEMLRRYALPSLKCWLTGLVITGVIVLNLVFYARSRLPIAGALQLLWLLVLWLWLAVHLFVFPLLLDQEVKTVPAVYRNAFVMTFARPVFTMVTALFWLAELTLASSTGLTVIIGLVLGAAIQQNAFSRLVPTFARTDAQ
jgi:uncharacterized membrane protein YesL